ncbi:MAG: hypothetical protein D6741_12715 [Planctomycetota bacterium]|nr:MAG: hypothetical protein D6741_12715 [Planctomycetota bacterium]
MIPVTNEEEIPTSDCPACEKKKAKEAAKQQLQPEPQPTPAPAASASIPVEGRVVNVRIEADMVADE